MPRKPAPLNHFYFDEPNLENSYWAGFLAADGNVDPRGNRIRLNLAEKDRSHLEKFNKCTSYGGKVYYVVRERRQNQVRCDYHSSRWASDLRYWNVLPQKTLSLLPPPITGDLALAYIVGYIDGDGSFGRTKDKYGYLRLTIVGTKEVNEWIREILGVRGYLGHISNVTRLCLGNKQSNEIRDRLLRLHVPRLDRKWKT